MQNNILTERLILRQLSLADAPGIFKLRTDASVNKYIDRNACPALEDAEKFITQTCENISKGQSCYWIIADKNTLEFAGTICLFNFSEDQKSAEIGYELLPAAQGKGYMLEAIEQVINFAKETLNLKMLEACVHKDNLASLNLIAHFNFIFIPGRPHEPDLHVFTINLSI